ncbi:hypothetical protein [Streptomyces sp. B21-083]|uniref:hypothetical protein n=1 Tax=Streptomyces sp. B21-083 TaxID=3039410 RepID=UPI002FF21F74
MSIERPALAVRRDLTQALKQQIKRTGEQESTVRGGDWRLAVVTVVGTDGTVTADGIPCRRMEFYPNPVVGDVIAITQSSSGNWLAWGRMVADTDGIGTRLFKRKTILTGPRTSATPAADPHLSVTLAPNASYTLEVFAKWSGDGASDINWSWIVPASATGSWVCYAGDTAMTALPTTMRSIDTSVNGGSRSFGVISTVIGVAMSGTVNTTTGGTFAANWGAQTGGGTGVTLYEDSWIKLERMA